MSLPKKTACSWLAKTDQNGYENVMFLMTYNSLGGTFFALDQPLD